MISVPGCSRKYKGAALKTVLAQHKYKRVLLTGLPCLSNVAWRASCTVFTATKVTMKRLISYLSSPGCSDMTTNGARQRRRGSTLPRGKYFTLANGRGALNMASYVACCVRAN